MGGSLLWLSFPSSSSAASFSSTLMALDSQPVQRAKSDEKEMPRLGHVLVLGMSGSVAHSIVLHGSQSKPQSEVLLGGVLMPDWKGHTEWQCARDDHACGHLTTPHSMPNPSTRPHSFHSLTKWKSSTIFTHRRGAFYLPGLVSATLTLVLLPSSPILHSLELASGAWCDMSTWMSLSSCGPCVRV
jgi:hypothetical protein